ncbi:MAG: type I pullulanase [Treponema sp.]|jgi:pullulanase|nr:type I pullulanase [Treponema sp.]
MMHPIIFAVADTADTVTLSEEAADYCGFAVYQGDTRLAGTCSKGTDGVCIRLNQNIVDPAKPYVVRDENGAFEDTPVLMRGILDDFYYDGNDLGLSYRQNLFKVWAPTAASVSIALYDDPGTYDSQGRVRDHATGALYAMERDIKTGLWSGAVPGKLVGKYYLYRVVFAGGRTVFAADPYARAVSANGQRMAIVDPADTIPPGWQADLKPPFTRAQDAVVYELHIRDFSIAGNSGMRHRGKFLAFTERGTTTPQGSPTGVDYLAALGITHVHLLPSFDFASVDELAAEPQFNWGYDPQNYNVPEGSYSTEPQNPAARIREFKQMVQALHAAGIRVVMDVVYNHTFRTGAGPFDSLAPCYYYRTDKWGRYTDGSACGNETASERPMVRKFIVDSVCYWAREYRIDGFRFDLMGLHDIDTMNTVRRELFAIDPSIIVYGEGWTAADSPLPPARRAVKANAALLDTGIAVFSDDIRDGIRGSVFYRDETGFVTGSEAEGARPDFRIEDVKFGIVGGTKHPQVDIKQVHYSRSFWAKTPAQSITYASAHDNLSLWDKLAATNPSAGEEYLLRLNKLAAAIVLTSQGIPFFQAGEEMARTKQGNENSYNAPDAVNMLDWSRPSRYRDLVEYYRGLIALRKTYVVFRLRQAADIRRRLRFLPTGAPGTPAERPLIAYTLDNEAGERYAAFTLIFNGSVEAQQVPVPAGEVLVNGEGAGTIPLGQVSGGLVSVPGKTALILGRLQTLTKK